MTGQYTSISHNVLFKTWVDWPGVYIDPLYLKCKKEERKKERKIKTKR